MATEPEVKTAKKDCDKDDSQLFKKPAEPKHSGWKKRAPIEEPSFDYMPQVNNQSTRTYNLYHWKTSEDTEIIEEGLLNEHLPRFDLIYSSKERRLACEKYEENH